MLAHQLLNEQIEAASEFWNEWEGEYKELSRLNEVFPGFDGTAVLLKAVVINTLYGTNVYAIEKVAECVKTVMSKANHATGPDLVEELVEEMTKVSGRKHHSFASKFAHFFIDKDLPILDQYAEFMVRWHLGSEQSQNHRRYLKFDEDIRKLKELAGLSCSNAQLDAYLWVAGEYLCWKKDPKVKITQELRELFEEGRRYKRPELYRLLTALLPAEVKEPCGQAKDL